MQDNPFHLTRAEVERRTREFEGRQMEIEIKQQEVSTPLIRHEWLRCPNCDSPIYLYNIGKKEYLVCHKCKIKSLLGSNIRYLWLNDLTLSKTALKLKNSNTKLTLRRCKPVNYL